MYLSMVSSVLESQTTLATLPVVHYCPNLLGTQSWFLAYLGTLWVPIPSFYPNRTKPFAFGPLWSANFRQPPLEPPLRSLGGFRGGSRGALGGPTKMTEYMALGLSIL